MSNSLEQEGSIVSPPEVRYTECFIGGRWVPAANGRSFETIHPATEEPVATIAEGDQEDIDRAVQAARIQFEEGEWRRMDARDRGTLMLELANLIEQNATELAALETLDNGKPVSAALHDDIPAVVDCLKYYAGWCDKIQGDTIPIRGEYFCYTSPEPVGVVGQIIPWNFPALMAAWKWGPALATGCTIVMKPAEQTPLTCLRMASLAQQAGIPDGVINVVPGFGPTAGAAIVRHPGIDKVAFTGESTTAKIIQREAANRMKRLTFELGGKNPNIVFADADLDSAIPGVHAAQYYNQGQSCSAGSRLFVQDEIYDEVVEGLIAMNAELKLGNPFDLQTGQGPHVDEAQLAKTLNYIEIGRNEGAQCVSGGKRWGERGYFVEPTLFAGVTDQMQIAQEEIFGPVLSVLRFRDEDEVIVRANNTGYGLAAAVWTSNLSRAHRVADSLRTGTVWVNSYDVFDAAAPFGGFGQSGIGRELGKVGLSAYLEQKTVTVSL